MPSQIGGPWFETLLELRGVYVFYWMLAVADLLGTRRESSWIDGNPVEHNAQVFPIAQGNVMAMSFFAGGFLGGIDCDTTISLRKSCLAAHRSISGAGRQLFASPPQISLTFLYFLLHRRPTGTSASQYSACISHRAVCFNGF